MTIEQVKSLLDKLQHEFVEGARLCEEEGGDEPFVNEQHVIKSYSTFLDDCLLDDIWRGMIAVNRPS
jgi:hypothetical protein